MSKSVVKSLVKLITENRLSYDAFNQACKLARAETGLKCSKKGKAARKPAKIENIRLFLDNVTREGNPRDQMMIKFLIFMGLRSFEVCGMKIDDMDLTPGHEVYYIKRKQGYDRTFCIPKVILGSLKEHIAHLPKGSVYLFESSYKKSMGTKNLRRIIMKHRNAVSIGKEIHAHEFRHQLITFLNGRGWTDRQIADISGHEIRNNISIYAGSNYSAIRAKLDPAMRDYYTLLY